MLLNYPYNLCLRLLCYGNNAAQQKMPKILRISLIQQCLNHMHFLCQFDEVLCDVDRVLAVNRRVLEQVRKGFGFGFGP